MKSYYANQVREAIREGKFGDKISNTAEGDKWKVAECYEKVLDLDLAPIAINISIFRPMPSDFEQPSLTPTVPILIAEWKNSHIVIDGMHRIAGGIKGKCNIIMGYILSEDVMNQLKQNT